MYSTEYRRKMAIMAREVGVNRTARRLGVNPKTVSVWRNRLLKDEGFENRGALPLSMAELTSVKDYVRSGGPLLLSEIQERLLPTRSKAAIYKILLSMNIPVTIPRIVRYRCAFCGEEPIALQIYYGLTKKPPCPKCQRGLTFVCSFPLKIFGKRSSLLILRNGALFPILEEEITLLEKGVEHTDSVFPLYCRDLLHLPHTLLHIVSVIEMNEINTLCEMIIIKKGTLLPSTSNEIRSNFLCTDCLLQANKRRSKGKPLKPTITPSIISKREIVMNAISLAFTIKNIKRACEFHKISRTTFYNYVRSLNLKDNLERTRHSL